jgi:hypothetical protein
MWRRSITFFSLLSALAFAVALGGFASGTVAQDDFQLLRWNPVSRTLTETTFSNRADGIAFHSRLTVALPTDSTAAVQARVGPSNRLLMHRRWPSGPSATPFLWGDHYHTTSVAGINASGTTECWTLHFRYELPLMLFGILPAAWVALRYVRSRRAVQRGFTVEPISAATSVQ